MCFPHNYSSASSAPLYKKDIKIYIFEQIKNPWYAHTQQQKRILFNFIWKREIKIFECIIKILCDEVGVNLSTDGQNAEKEIVHMLHIS